MAGLRVGSVISAPADFAQHRRRDDPFIVYPLDMIDIPIAKLPPQTVLTLAAIEAIQAEFLRFGRALTSAETTALLARVTADSPSGVPRIPNRC
jgi:hypothetical protein